jgi:hypothetical protein
LREPIHGSDNACGLRLVSDLTLGLITATGHSGRRGLRAVAHSLATLVVCLAGLFFDPLRQSLVVCSDFANLPLGVGVVHGIGSMHKFLGACSPSKGVQSKP